MAEIVLEILPAIVLSALLIAPNGISSMVGIAGHVNNGIVKFALLFWVLLIVEITRSCLMDAAIN